MGKKYTLFNVQLDGLDDKQRWYTLTTAYNYEQKVTNDIKKLIETDEFKNSISDVFSGTKVTQSLYTVKSGEIKIKNKNDKIFMNYVFVKTIMNPKIWNTIMNITGVSAFICVAGRPVYTDDEKIEYMRSILEPELITKQQYLDFKSILETNNEKFIINKELEKKFNIQ